MASNTKSEVVAAKIFKKYGVNLKITKLGKEVTRLFYPTSLKTKLNFKIKTVNLQFPALTEEEINIIPGSNKSNVKTVDVCEYENCNKTEHLQVHHINKIGKLYKRKDLSEFQKDLIRRKRKVVMLCKNHYDLLHRKGILSKSNQS